MEATFSRVNHRSSSGDLDPADDATQQPTLLTATHAGSCQRFDDGSAFRVEIPSVETPEMMRIVLEESAARNIVISRISQGSGIMLLTDDEITEMVDLGRERNAEVCLFIGPRGAWDTGVQAMARSGGAAGAVLRGTDQIEFAMRDVRRACALGARSLLVSDIGLIAMLGRMRTAGDLPADLLIKVSASLPVANPPTARLLEELGANSLNLTVDLGIADMGAIRDEVGIPVDMYVEAPEDLGACVRYHEIPEMVRVAAPIYLKFAVRNAASLYPYGEHLRDHAIATARERVRRAAIGVAMLTRDAPHGQSPVMATTGRLH